MARIIIHSFQPWAHHLTHPGVRGPVEGESWEALLRNLADPFGELTRTDHGVIASLMAIAAANHIRLQIWNALVDAGGEAMLDQTAIDALSNETALTSILEGRHWPWNVPLVVVREGYDLKGLDFPEGPHVEALSGWTARDAIISVARCGGWRIFADWDEGEEADFAPSEARLISYDPARDGLPHILGTAPAANADVPEPPASVDAHPSQEGHDAPTHQDDVVQRHKDRAPAREDDAPRSALGFSFTIEDELPPF